MNFLPGWHPGFIAAGVQAIPTSITQVASATSTTGTLTAPANIQAGDLLVIVQRSSSDTSTPPSAVTPSGFLTANNVSNSTGGGKSFASRQIVNYKLATGAEASTNFSVMTGSDVDASIDQRSIMVVFRPNVPASAIVLADVEGAMSNGGVGPFTIASGSGIVPLVAIYSFGGFDVSISAPLSTPAEDGDVFNAAGNNNDISLSWKIYNTSPANVVTFNITSTDDATIQSMYFELS